MMGKCCIANCKNSSSECEESISFFKVPSETDLFDKWSKAVESTGSFLNKNSVVCERHFREDQIKRLAVIKDSFGNVIFQRPLVKFSLVKDAVPSIFHKDIEVTMGKKRKTASLEQQNDLNTVGNFSEDNSDVNCSNIVVSFHEDQTSSIQYIPNSSQALPTNAGSVNHITAIPNYQIEGTQPIFRNNENGQIQIYMSSQGFGEKPLNNIENNSGNKTSACLDSILVDKQQILQRIPNPQGSNVDQISKELTIIIPEDEVVYLNQTNNNNNCSPQKKIKRLKKSTTQNPLQQSEKDMNLRSFDLIYQNSDKIKLPNSTWGYHKNDKDNNIMVFSKVKWFSTNACTLPLYERQVIFHESNELKIYINNIFSPLETPRPRDIIEMEQVLLDVDKLSLCSGGPSIEFAQTAALAQKDHAVGRWRHKYCPIVVANDENICKYCSSINQVFRYPKQKRIPFGKRVQRAQTQKLQSKNGS